MTRCGTRSHQLPATFKTKDLSGHPSFLATHTDVAQLGNYHAIVGRYLMKNRDRLGLIQPGRPVDDRGSLWTKVGSQAPSPCAGGTTEPHARCGGGRPASATRRLGKGADSRRRLDHDRAARGLLGHSLVRSAALGCFEAQVRSCVQEKDVHPGRDVCMSDSARHGLFSHRAYGRKRDANRGRSDIGGLLFLLFVPAAAVILAILYRNPAGEIPGAAEEFSRRKLGRGTETCGDGSVARLVDKGWPTRPATRLRRRWPP